MGLRRVVSLPGILLAVFVCGVFCDRCHGEERSRREPAFVADPGVEDEVRTAFERAWEKLPPPHRRCLDGIRLARSKALEIPSAAPLVLRLQAAAANAWYQEKGRTIVVADAGVRGEGWTSGDASRSEVKYLLATLADVLGASVPADPADPALDEAWRRLESRLETASPGERAPSLPVGAARVLDQLVRHVVRIALGGTRPSLESLLVHELGHAVQASGSGFGSEVLAWGRLSGWIARETGEPAHGFEGGATCREDPIVLVRLVLGADRGPGSIYSTHPDARFVTPYARYDPREDFAESYRVFLEDPARLARIAPLKLLGLNALGWAATADDQDAGPPFFEDWARVPWIDDLRPGLAALIGERLPSPGVLDAAGILRASGDLLARLSIEPPARGAFILPPDLPREVLASWHAGAGEVVSAGRTYHLSPEALAVELDEMVEKQRSREEFAVGINGFRDGETDLTVLLQDETGSTAAALLADAIDRLGTPARVEAWSGHVRVQDEPVLRALLDAERLRSATDPAPALVPLKEATRRLDLASQARILVHMTRPGMVLGGPLIEAGLAWLDGVPGRVQVPAARAILLDRRRAIAPEAERSDLAKRACEAAREILTPSLRQRLLVALSCKDPADEEGAARSGGGARGPDDHGSFGDPGPIRELDTTRDPK